jgi:hypothetical protein
MRLALKIIFVLLITAAKAQPKKASCTEITRAGLSQKKISDLIPAPQNCTLKSYFLSCKVHGRVMTFTSDGELSKSVIDNLDAGTTLYFDIEYTCNSKTRHESHCYKLVK